MERRPTIAARFHRIMVNILNSHARLREADGRCRDAPEMTYHGLMHIRVPPALYRLKAP